MYLQDFINGDDPNHDIVALALAKPRYRKDPSWENALREINDTLTKVCVSSLTNTFVAGLYDAYVAYTLDNGEYDDIPSEVLVASSDFESGVDDMVEAYFEPYEEHLSANWLGENTVETLLWLTTEDNMVQVERIAKSAAKEVVKQLSHDKTPAQVRANAGFADEALRERITELNSKGDDIVSATENNLDAVIAKMKTYLGKDFDQLEVLDDVETVLEEDDAILAGSAASRIGIGDDDAEILQMAALDMDDAPSEIIAMVDAYKAPTAAAKKKAAAAKKKEEDESADNIDPSVLQALKDAGVPDTATAESLGVSRSTYTKYIKGTTAFAPDPEQYETIRNLLVERTNSLLTAMATLDGTELTQVA